MGTRQTKIELYKHKIYYYVVIIIFFSFYQRMNSIIILAFLMPIPYVLADNIAVVVLENTRKLPDNAAILKVIYSTFVILNLKA